MYIFVYLYLIYYIYNVYTYYMENIIISRVKIYYFSK